MATSFRYSLHPFSMVHAGGTLSLNQIEQFEFQPNTRVHELIAAGDVDRSQVGFSGADPVWQLATRDLTTLFADVSATAGLAASGTATAEFQQRADGGTFSGAGNHETYTAPAGFLRPVSLSASMDDDDGAVCNLEFHPLSSDGYTESTSHNTSQSLSGSPGFTSRFFMGPVYRDPDGVSNAEINGVTQWSLDFGINYVARRQSGRVWATVGSIVTRQPVLRMTLTDLSDDGGENVFGRTLGTTMDFYLHKGTTNGARVAVGSSVHLKVSLTAGMWRKSGTSAQGNEDGTTTYETIPTGTIGLSVTSTIP